MTFARKSGGANVALTTVKRRSGGAWANVQTVKRRLGGAWVTVWTAYTPVSAAVSPTSLVGNGSGGTVTTTLPANITASGGTGSYTFSWELVSGSSTITPVSPTAASTRFSAFKGSGTVSAVYRGKASDGTTSAYTANVTITLSN